MKKNIENTEYIPFALPDIGEEEIQSVVNCMRSGWLTTGINAKKFESDFSEYIGDPSLDSISVNSASMGIMLACEALGLKKDDEVILPVYTFSASAMMPYHLGIKPVFVDIDEASMNIDPLKIEAAITSKTKAIMVVHFAGLACDMDTIKEIAKKHNLLLLEDAAHCLPATYNRRMVGNHSSDATIFSFYATKTITTGEGGMIVTSRKEVADRCKIMRLHGISRDVFDRYTAKGSKWYYEIVAPGQKCNLTDVAASIGIEQLKKANKFAERRKEIANKYFHAFKELPIILPQDALKSDIHSWHLFVIRIKKEASVDRDAFIGSMNEYGVGCSVHFIPLHYHPFWQEALNVKVGDFPVAEKAYEAAVSLPIYTKMTDEHVNKVIEAVKKILC